MSTVEQKVEAEVRVRELLESEGLPAPDDVEYGHQCVRLFWSEPKVVLVVDLEPEEGADQRDDAGGSSKSEAPLTEDADTP